MTVPRWQRQKGFTSRDFFQLCKTNIFSVAFVVVAVAFVVFAVVAVGASDVAVANA